VNERSFTLTDPEIDILMNALADQPFRHVNNLIQKILAQANAPKPPPAAAAVPVAAEPGGPSAEAAGAGPA
jgi:hypothetical protein